MPSKKKKYNARFPAGRIKKIMQTDEEVGKVAQAVPIIISKALEMFIESLLKKSTQITQNRNAKTLTPSHMKQCILSENRFDFLKDLVKNVPDASIQEDNENNALAESNVDFGVISDEASRKEELNYPLDINFATPPANFYTEQSTSKASSGSRTPVIKFGPKAKEGFTFPVSHHSADDTKQSALNLTSPPNISNIQVVSSIPNKSDKIQDSSASQPSGSRDSYGQNSTDDNLLIDEDYDN